MASSSTSSSSTTTLTRKYEVFLSFRGLDTRQGFTSHLYDALCQKNIKTFRDDVELRKGVDISPDLLRAIEESKIAVVIFSKNYASSAWCLAELAEIIKRMQLKELIVMPVFYHVDTNDVWDEAELVREIVKAVWRELRSKYTPSPSDFKGLVGIHERIEHVKSLLRPDMKDVRKTVGIWGMGSVGKTTIARAVFKSISYQFDSACFIEEVGKRLDKKGGLDHLQLEVLSKVLHEENTKLGTPIRPDKMEMLNQKKVFIVLDDVNDFIELKSLFECLHQCGLGSRMIITSRDKQVLRNFEVDDHDIYEEGLDYVEALELFCEHANPTEDCMALSEEIVNFAEGNPLALEVLGSFLKKKDKQVWESALNNLQGIVNPKVFDVLKISYDGLNQAAQDLFLDLACFSDLYVGDVKEFPLTEAFLDCQEYKHPLEVLVDKKLIQIYMDRERLDIYMHDLLREMGREIVCSKSPKILGNRSRLWKQDDVIQILEKNTGTAAVEGISLDMGNLEEDIDLSSEVFDKMDNLRIILFYTTYLLNKVHLPNGLNCLPDELMILYWPHCPLRELPPNFKPKKLVTLDLSRGDIVQLWKGTKRAPKLKRLNLSHCRHLTKIPNLSDFPLLVKVDLTNCKSLVDLTSSGQQLNNLRYLTLEGCINVTKFPLISENIETLNLSGTAIEEVPSSIQSLTNLTKLDLSECTRLKHISPSICKLKSLSDLSLRGCSQFETLSEILETMESLKSLVLNGSAIKELPLSIGHLNGLQGLYLHDCKNLEMLPSTICNLSSLEEFYLSNCSKLDKLPDELGNLKSLKKLIVSGFAVGRLPSSITSLENLEELKCSRCNLMGIPEDIDCLFSLKKLDLSGNMFESLPKSIKQFSKLETLSLSHCNMLQSLPEFPKGLQCLEAMDCEQLCQVPDASEFVRCINSKDFISSYHFPVQFIFANSFNLKTAVSNVFEESLRLMQRIKKESGTPSNQFSFYLPGNEIPEWFSGQSLESSVKIRVLRNDLVNRKFMGFAICAVLRVDEYNSRCEHRFMHRFHCNLKIFPDHIKIGNLPSNSIKGPSIFMDSEHMLLGYCPFYSSSQNPEKPPDSDYLNILFEFGYDCGCYGLKRCAVHPIYAEEPLEIIGATIQEIGETSGRRSDRSNDNDEEVEPHPKRICTQAILETMESLKDLELSAFSVIRPDSKPSPSDFEGLIGIHKRIEHVKSSCLDMKDVRKIIGIWGMGGVGKTTIARAVFKSISHGFDGACFIEKVGKRLENGGSDRLQLEVLSEVLHEENLKLGTPTIRPFIMELLNQKKVFIVLDDVNNFLQLETLAQVLNRCGLGSRIIITSRDKQVLCNFNIDDREIYEAEGFNDDEALELFHKHANPAKDCMALSEKIVNYAKGNPLALEVLGLSLKGMSKQVWESALKKLQGIVNPGIFDVLKISYDGLNEEEKKLFLDLACFGDLYNYHGLLKEEFLDHLEHSLGGLVAKSLITRHIRTGDIEMHDLLQEMGREIDPGKRNRLWERNDVICTLEKNTGTDAVEAISLDMDDLEDIHLSSQVFDEMHNLRFLIFHSMYGSDKVLHLPNGLNCLPDELMFLHWFGYPLRALPLNFKPEKLVKLDLFGSNIEQLWEGTKRAPKLRWLNLSYCEHLTRIPNLSDFPLLVEVDLSHCESLVDFPSSDQQHNNLRNLNMSETAIEEVPSSIQSLTNLTELKLAECTRLKHISDRICKLKSLSTLDLTDCSKLEIFPEILETMESLKDLKLSALFKINMDLKVLPPSIEHLNGLRSLTLNGCKNLEMLPSSICNLTSLEDLYLTYCSKRVKLPDNLGNLKSLKRLTVTGSAVGQLPSSITYLENLEDLDCSGCSLMEIPEDIDRLSSLKKLKLSRNMFESLPKSIKQLSKLEFLSLSHCNMLRSLPEFPGLECLEAMDCDQLCQVPDASEFVRCINSKSHRVDFIFTNSLNLIKAVSSVFEEIMQRTKKGSGKPPNEFSIYLPGNKIPEWFKFLPGSLESSVNIQVLRNDLVNRKFMGFAICAVFGCDQNDTRVRFTHGVGCVFKIHENNIEICNGNRIYRTHYGSDLPSIFIDSDHMLLGYCSFYSRNPMELPAGDSDHVDISIEFKICDNGNQPKRWAVHPIYASQEIGETSRRRSDRSDDNDEEVEPHSKRICTQEI